MSNLDDPTYGLAHDLSLPANEVPAFNWITPNNCSDAHDATCQGNNLSGAFNANGTPNYTPSGLPAYDPEATTPLNYTGGLYASDLFLRYYIPLIEQSTAFADGGLIDVTFDEANPPFTVGNSFNNVPAPGDVTTSGAPADQPTFGANGTTAPGANSLYGAYGVLADAAGENLNGTNVNTEPTGPNDPEVTNATGQQFQPGPGASGFIDRPTGLTGESPNLSGSPGRRRPSRRSSPRDRAWCSTPRSTRTTPVDWSRGPVSRPTRFVGAVSDTGPISSVAQRERYDRASNNYAKPWMGSFQLLNDSGQPVTLTAGLSAPSRWAPKVPYRRSERRAVRAATRRRQPLGCVTADPLYDPTDFTPGGGDTGTVLISPFIKPGTVSEHVLQPLQHAAHAGGPAPHRTDLHQPLERRHAARGGHGLRRPRRPGPHRLRRAVRTRVIRSRCLHRPVLHHADDTSGLQRGQWLRLDDSLLPAYFRLGLTGIEGSQRLRQGRRHRGHRWSAGLRHQRRQRWLGWCRAHVRRRRRQRRQRRQRRVSRPKSGATESGSPPRAPRRRPPTLPRAMARGVTAVTVVTVGTARTSDPGQWWQRRRTARPAIAGPMVRTVPTASEPDRSMRFLALLLAREGPGP